MSTRDEQRRARARSIAAGIVSTGISAAARRSEDDAGEGPDGIDTSAPKLGGETISHNIAHDQPYRKEREARAIAAKKKARRKQGGRSKGQRRGCTPNELDGQSAETSVAGASPTDSTTCVIRGCALPAGTCGHGRLVEVPAKHEHFMFRDGGNFTIHVTGEPVTAEECEACSSQKLHCAKCGGVILAETEDWREPLCPEHYEALTIKEREHEELMAAARKAQVHLSKGENGKKRKASVERYLYQFMRGHGQTSSRAFKDNWEATFGKKEPKPLVEKDRR